MENRGISIISGFDVNTFAPIDSRLVATSSSIRESITYKYQGLKVYQTDVNKTYAWDGATWSVEGNGIYGGSGSLVGDTVVNMGPIGNSVGQQSYSLGFLTNPTTTTQNNTVTDRFIRWSSGSTFQGVEYRRQLYNNGTASSYISLNSQSATLNGNIDIGFGTGLYNKRFTILSDGTGIQLWSPTFSALISVTALSMARTYILPDTTGTIALLSDIAASYPTLQAVTTAGNSTNYGIQLLGSSFSIVNTLNKTVGFIGPGEMSVSTDYYNTSGWGISIAVTSSTTDGSALIFKQGNFRSFLKIAPITTNQQITFPNSTGTVALLSDLTTAATTTSWRYFTSALTTVTIPATNYYAVLTGNGGTITLPSASGTSTTGTSILLELRGSSGTWTINTINSAPLSGLSQGQIIRVISDGVAWQRW